MSLRYFGGSHGSETILKQPESRLSLELATKEEVFASHTHCTSYNQERIPHSVQAPDVLQGANKEVNGPLQLASWKSTVLQGCALAEKNTCHTKLSPKAPLQAFLVINRLDVRVILVALLREGWHSHLLRASFVVEWLAY